MHFAFCCGQHKLSYPTGQLRRRRDAHRSSGWLSLRTCRKRHAVGSVAVLDKKGEPLTDLGTLKTPVTARCRCALQLEHKAPRADLPRWHAR
jgi:hypothetical protein